MDDYYRGIVAGSTGLGRGTVLGGLGLYYNDGPWDQPDNYAKVNGVLRYSGGDHENGFNVTGMAYQGSWHATDQIPEQAVTLGLVSRLGQLDTTDGGRSYRYSISADWRHEDDSGGTEAGAYFGDGPACGSTFRAFDEPMCRTNLVRARGSGAVWSSLIMLIAMPVAFATISRRTGARDPSLRPARWSKAHDR